MWYTSKNISQKMMTGLVAILVLCIGTLCAGVRGAQAASGTVDSVVSRCDYDGSGNPTVIVEVHYTVVNTSASAVQMKLSSKLFAGNSNGTNTVTGGYWYQVYGAEDTFWQNPTSASGVSKVLTYSHFCYHTMEVYATGVLQESPPTGSILSQYSEKPHLPCVPGPPGSWS